MDLLRFLRFAAPVVVAGMSGASADTFTWDSSGGAPLGDGGGSWTATGGSNWFNGSAYGAWGNSSSDEAVFGAGSGAAGNVSVGTVTTNKITFSAPGSGSYTLSGGTITLAGTTPAITTHVNATLSTVLAGTSGLVKSGSGNLTLSGASSYSGGTTVSYGTVIVTGNNAALGSGAVTLGDANTGSGNVALLITAGRSIANAITVSNQGTGTATLGRSGGGGFAAMTGDIALQRDLILETTASATDRLAFDGKISGTGNLTIQGGQRITLGGANTFTGDVFIAGTNTVLQNFNTNGNIPDDSRVDVGTGTTFRVFQSEAIGALTGSGTVESLNTAGPVLTVGGGNASGNFSGNWANNATNGVNLTKTGTGTQTLSGTASTSIGTLTIHGGVVEAALIANGGAASSIGASANTANKLVFGSPSATLRYVGSSHVTTDRGFTLSSGAGGGATIESSGTGTLSFDNTVPIAYGGGNQTRSLTLGGTSTGANTFGKVIANNGSGTTSLTKEGTGSWTLAAANTYSGATTIKAGTLKLAGSGSIGNSSAIIVGDTAGSAAVLDVSTAGGGFTLGSAQLLRGSGTINGDVSVNGTFAPGNGIESLGAGAVTFNSTSTCAYEFSSSSLNADLLYLSGALAIENGAQLAIGDLGLDVPLANGTKFTLISYVDSSPSWTGGLFSYEATTLADGATFTLGANQWRFDYNDLAGGGNYSTDQGGAARHVTMTVIPEPASVLLAGLGCFVLFRRRRPPLAVHPAELSQAPLSITVG